MSMYSRFVPNQGSSTRKDEQPAANFEAMTVSVGTKQTQQAALAGVKPLLLRSNLAECAVLFRPTLAPIGCIGSMPATSVRLRNAYSLRRCGEAIANATPGIISVESQTEKTYGFSRWVGLMDLRTARSRPIHTLADTAQ